MDHIHHVRPSEIVANHPWYSGLLAHHIPRFVEAPKWLPVEPPLAGIRKEMGEDMLKRCCHRSIPPQLSQEQGLKFWGEVDRPSPFFVCPGSSRKVLVPRSTCVKLIGWMPGFITSVG